MSQPSTFDPKSWTHRISVHAMYYKIACDQMQRYHERDAEHSKLQVDMENAEELGDTSQRMEKCYEDREQSAVIAITFAGMALEAFFYDYGAERLGDAFVAQHLDRLDLPSKFLVYPRMICGKSPDKSAAAYGSLKKLVRLRNDLVHFKSQPFGLEEMAKASAFHDNLNEKLKLGVDQAIQAVQLVLTELGALHATGSLFTQRMNWSIGRP